MTGLDYFLLIAYILSVKPISRKSNENPGCGIKITYYRIRKNESHQTYILPMKTDSNRSDIYDDINLK